MRGEPKHQPVVLEHEGVMSRFITREAALDERSFATGDIRPPNSFGRLRGEVSCQVGPPRI
jgi:hypothetical protein